MEKNPSERNVSKILSRTDLRNTSTIDDCLRVSLQSCSLKVNEIKLEGLLSQVHKRDGRKANMLEGLLFVLNQLLATNGNGKSIGFMDFNDVYDLHCGFFSGVSPEKDRFWDNLLHLEHGLTIFIARTTPKKR